MQQCGAQCLDTTKHLALIDAAAAGLSIAARFWAQGAQGALAGGQGSWTRSPSLTSAKMQPSDLQAGDTP